jgi:DNA primase
MKTLNTTNEQILVHTTDLYQIEILGGVKINHLDRLKVTLRVNKRGYETEYTPLRMNVDLYNQRAYQKLLEDLHAHFDCCLHQTIRCIAELTQELEDYRMKRIEEKDVPVVSEEPLTGPEKASAINTLRAKNLIQNVRNDLSKFIIGEQTNAMLLYLAMTSRLLKKPLQILLQAESGTGKSYLLEQVGKLMPVSEITYVTSLSSQVMFYYKDKLKHKILVIEDFDGLDASGVYAVREIQSKGELNKVISAKNSEGEITTIDYHVQGPIMVATASTKPIYQDNANRCLILNLDNSTEQTERILKHQRQRATTGNHSDEEISKLIEKHRVIQRMLKPYKVVIPFAESIHLPVNINNPRRTLQMLLTTVEVITLFNQYQRQVKNENGEEYLIATPQDLELAMELLKDSILNKVDELTGATRAFLERLKEFLRGKDLGQFNAKEMRLEMKISSSAMGRYIKELDDNFYIEKISSNRLKGFEYRVRSYNEYTELKSSVDKELSEILKINQIPVSQ